MRRLGAFASGTASRDKSTGKCGQSAQMGRETHFSKMIDLRR